MALAINYTTLKTRCLADTQFGGDGATPSLARALERIGWRAVRDPSPEELAGYLVELLEACVFEHRDLTQLTAGIAATLRACGPMLDGGLPPVEAYLPAAEDVLRRYVDGEHTPREAPSLDTNLLDMERFDG